MEKPLEECHENPRKRLINELLIEGKSFATQLQTLLQKPIIADHGSVSADELLVKIWSSFTQAITEVNSLGSKGFFQIEEVDQSDSSDRKSKDSSSEFTKKKNKLVGKDRRGCYKRRKTSDSRIRESATIEDGCAWRKYGQKNILNSKYPRCYFRCTHKYNQECRATKQVQIIQENPIIYHTTYFGHHTCNSVKIPKHEIITSQESHHSMMYYSPFEVKPKFFSSETHDSTVKLEEESNKVQSDDDVSSTMDSNLWQDFMPSSPSARSTMTDHSSYFDQVIIPSYVEDFGKFGDFHFEEFS